MWPVHEKAIYLITLSWDSSLWVSFQDIPIYTFLRNILVSEVLLDLNFTFDYLMQLGPKLQKWITEETYATRSTGLRKEREM